MRLFHRYLLTILPSILGTVAVVSVVFVVTFDWFADRTAAAGAAAMADALERQFETRARLAARVTAEALVNPLALHDLAAAEMLIRVSATDPDVESAYVYDAESGYLYYGDGGLQIMPDGRPDDPYPIVTAATGPKSWRSEDRLNVLTPIMLGDRVLGYVGVELKLDPIDLGIAALSRELDELQGEESRAMLTSLAAVIGFLLPAAVAASLIAARRLSRPILALADVAERIGRGAYDFKLPAGGRDEVGDLGRSMQAMADALRRTTVSRDYLDSIIGGMLDGLVVVTPEGAIETINEAGCRLTGYRQDELIGQPVDRILVADPATGPAIAANEDGHCLLTKDGGRLPILVSTAQLQGLQRASVRVFRDISDLRQQQAELVAAKEEATAANQLKSQFLANMSHELRTPLNAIIGFSEVMKDGMLGPLDTTYRGYAKDIHHSGRHLLELITDILDMSRLESGNMPLHEDAVMLETVIEDAARMLREQAKRAEIELRLETGSSLPALRADERMVRQILVNLLSNAIKFTPVGGSVVAGAALDDTARLYLTVTDTGPGIAAQDIPRVMKPFVQAKNAAGKGGTGLGLPIARALAELHGGALAIESVPGAGTTIRVQFPAERTVHSGIGRSMA